MDFPAPANLEKWFRNERNENDGSDDGSDDGDNDSDDGEDNHDGEDNDDGETTALSPPSSSDVLESELSISVSGSRCSITESNTGVVWH